MKNKATLISNENGVKWYELTGSDFGTGIDFDCESVGLTEYDRILDCDGCPYTEGDYNTIAIRNMLNI